MGCFESGLKTFETFLEITNGWFHGDAKACSWERSWRRPSEGIRRLSALSEGVSDP